MFQFFPVRRSADRSAPRCINRRGNLVPVPGSPLNSNSHLRAADRKYAFLSVWGTVVCNHADSLASGHCKIFVCDLSGPLMTLQPLSINRGMSQKNCHYSGHDILLKIKCQIAAATKYGKIKPRFSPIHIQ